MHPVTSPSPTQYALVICFLVLGPALGVAAGMVQWRRRENMAIGALAASGSSWIGWLVSCAVALVLFPGYPERSGPPEWLAILVTVPGMGAGALVIHWLHARRAPVRGTANGARGTFAVVAALTIALALGLVKAHAAVTTWPARRELPASAIVLSEEAYEGGFPLSDYSYSIRARMSRAEFVEWMERLGVQAIGEADSQYEREGSSETDCGARGSYIDGVGHFSSWCS